MEAEDAKVNSWGREVKGLTVSGDVPLTSNGLDFRRSEDTFPDQEVSILHNLCRESRKFVVFVRGCWSGDLVGSAGFPGRKFSYDEILGVYFQSSHFC